MGFTLIDDGTLDTVVVCDDCDKEMRFDSAVLLEGVYTTDKDKLEDARITNALELAEYEHECEED